MFVVIVYPLFTAEALHEINMEFLMSLGICPYRSCMKGLLQWRWRQLQ